MRMHNFILQRHEDPTGVSGVGTVAEGVVFSDGHVALRWLTANRSTSFWVSLDELISVHCHHGMSKIVWIDSSD